MTNLSELTNHLPPGVRFSPTDEELLFDYLRPKILRQPGGHHNLLPEIDVLKFDLPKLSAEFSRMSRDKELFFFSPVERKYVKSKRLARKTEKGYWRHSGNPHAIMRKDTGMQIGFKNLLVFYEGNARQGKTTNWVITEYHLNPELLGNGHVKTKMLPYVVSRITNNGGKKPRVDRRAQTPFNQEGEHSSNNPSNHAADAQPEIPVEESRESVHPLQGLDGILSTHKTTPAYQPQAGGSQGSSSFLAFSDDTNGFGLNLGPIRSPSSDFGFCSSCFEDLSTSRCTHG